MMVRGNAPGSSFEPSTQNLPQQQQHNVEFNGNQNKWPQNRPPMRVFFPGPRRGMHPRAGFFPGPRMFPGPPQQFYNQHRKPRPYWTPRGPRPPFLISASPEVFIPFPPPPWPPPPTPQVTNETDTTGEPPLKKKKRTSNCSLKSVSKPWDREAAERAHALELECQKNANSKSIVIRFPDPDLSKEVVHGFHSAIDNVHFQGPCGGRYCFVTLKDEADVETVMNEISKIKFGCGYLNAERKAQKPEENASHEIIDPFSLYVGNLAPNISVTEVKEKFPTAARIDVGHAKKMKNTRYAFVKFTTAEAALEAYKSSVNTIMASRSIIVRFRRHKTNVAPPTEKPATNDQEVKPTEKLTVGAKLKAKKEKAKAEKAARDKENRIKKKKETGKDGDVDDEGELENDESDSEEEAEDETDAEDDDEEGGDEGEEESEEEGYEEDEDEVEGGEDDDDDDDDLSANLQDEDDEYMDDDDYKDIFTLTFAN